MGGLVGRSVSSLVCWLELVWLVDHLLGWLFGVGRLASWGILVGWLVSCYLMTVVTIMMDDAVPWSRSYSNM